MLKFFRTFIIYTAGISIGGLVTLLVVQGGIQDDINNMPAHRFSKSRILSSAPSPEGEVEEPGTGSHTGLNERSMIILFTFMAIMFGAILKEVKKKTKIPYSPMLLLFGVAIGYFSDKLWIFGEAVIEVNKIEPHTLLMIFIPGLVFEGAYNSDGYVLNKSKWQVLLMAGPGVLLTTVILAYALQYIFGYKDSMTLQECLVMSSVIATTDPVAVVALLKELGTSIRFNTLLEGESLLNDGTAYVLFLVCLDVVKKGTFEFFPALIKFFRLSFGGPLLGIIVGYLSCRWMEVILKDTTLITVITVVSTYLIFFFSETYLQVSGILGLVAFGVYLGTYGRAHLNHTNDHSVHIVWSFVAFVLETLIFIITGTYVGSNFNSLKDKSIVGSDIWKAILFYFFVMIVRTGINLLMNPIMNKIGYKVSWKSSLILSYGGLRGAIALALGMLVALDQELSPKFRDICIFFIIVIIVMSIMINGMTIKFLMKKTGFLKEDPIKHKLKHNLLRKFLLNTLKHEKEMKHQKHLTGANWKKVEKLVHLVNYKILEKLDKKKATLIKKEKKKIAAKANSTDKEFRMAKAKIPVSAKLKTRKKRPSIFAPKEDGGNPFGIITHGGAKIEGIAVRKSHKKRSLILSQTNAKISLLPPPDSNLDEEEPAMSEVVNPMSMGSVYGAVNSVLQQPSVSNSNSMSQSGVDRDHQSASEDLDQMMMSQDKFFSIEDKKLIQKEMRLRIYKLAKHHINKKFDNNECGSSVVLTLKKLCDICSDHLDQKICFSEYTKMFIGGHKFLEFLLKMSKLPLVGGYFLGTVSKSIFHEYQILEVIISCCKQIGKEIKNVDLLSDYNEEVQIIREELTVDMNELILIEDSLIVQFSGLVDFMKTKLAAYSLIQFQKKQVSHFLHTGMIDEREQEIMISKLDKRIVDINNYKPKKIEINSISSFKLDFPIFAVLTPEELEFIEEVMTTKEFKKGGQVIGEGDTCEYLFLVKSGVVKEEFKGNKVYRKTRGDMVNIANICHQSGTYLSTLTTMSNAKLIKVRKLVLDKIMEDNKTFEQKCYQQSFIYFIRYLENTQNSYKATFSDIDDSTLNFISRRTILRKLEKRDTVHLPRGGFLISGSVYYNIYDKKGRSVTKVKFKEMGIIIPTIPELKAVKNSVILEFEIDVLNENKQGLPAIDMDCISMYSTIHKNSSSRMKKSENLAGFLKDSYKTQKIFENSKNAFDEGSSYSIGERSVMLLNQAEILNEKKKKRFNKKTFRKNFTESVHSRDVSPLKPLNQNGEQGEDDEESGSFKLTFYKKKKGKVGSMENFDHKEPESPLYKKKINKNKAVDLHDSEVPKECKPKSLYPEMLLLPELRGVKVRK